MTLGISESTSMLTVALANMKRPVLYPGEINYIIGNNLLEEAYNRLMARGVFPDIEDNQKLAARIKHFLHRE